MIDVKGSMWWDGWLAGVLSTIIPTLYQTTTTNTTEAIALIAAVLMEMIRDGHKSVAELMDLGRSLLGHRQVCVCMYVWDVGVLGVKSW